MGNINLANQGNLTPEVTLFGDWDLLTEGLKQLPIAIAAGALAGQLAAAKKIQAIVKKNIRNNGPAGTSWAPLAMSTQLRKAKAGKNPDRIWYYNGTYYKNIKVMQKGFEVTVGVPKNVRGRVHPNKNLTLIQIARILENGSPTHNIPARPLWDPSFKEFGGKDRVAYHISWHIRRTVNTMTGLRAKID